MTHTRAKGQGQRLLSVQMLEWKRTDRRTESTALLPVLTRPVNILNRTSCSEISSQDAPLRSFSFCCCPSTCGLWFCRF